MKLFYISPVHRSTASTLISSFHVCNIDECQIIHFIILSLTGPVEGNNSINICIWPIYFFTAKSKSGLINPFPLMQSKKLYPPHIMFHPASPTVMASQIGLSWGGLGLLCSCCCLIWGLGVLQVLTWPDLKDLQRHINILCETTDYEASESLALQKRKHYNVRLSCRSITSVCQLTIVMKFISSQFLWLISACVKNIILETKINSNIIELKLSVKCMRYEILHIFHYICCYIFLHTTLNVKVSSVKLLSGGIWDLTNNVTEI